MSANTIVGRFRAGHQIDDRPASIEEWRITTGDPDVAAKVYELYGGQAPQEWAAKGEDNIEVFTASAEVAVIIECAKALRQRMVLWGRSGKPIYVSNGDAEEVAALDGFGELPEYRSGVGAEPDIELYFRLAEDPELGVFKFKTGSWGFASDLAYNGVAEALEAAEGPTKAILKLEPVSFVAKNGPRKGQTVSYRAARLSLSGRSTP
ncbi:hypothetical protein [Microbacterium sp. NPDC056234]|uniref:recombination directionality factor n=1 Tax=Microbacterium sp. NPDC056234 TaxID=3345757 RepID=UPI0035DCD783